DVSWRFYPEGRLRLAMSLIVVWSVTLVLSAVSGFSFSCFWLPVLALTIGAVLSRRSTRTENTRRVRRESIPAAVAMTLSVFVFSMTLVMGGWALDHLGAHLGQPGSWDMISYLRQTFGLREPNALLALVLMDGALAYTAARVAYLRAAYRNET